MAQADASFKEAQSNYERNKTLFDKGIISKSDWDKSSVGKMITDNTSSVAPEMVENLILNLNLKSLSPIEKEALAVLKSWKGSNNLNDVAPTIYNKWIYLYLKNTFQDELGDEMFKQFLGTHIMKQKGGSLPAFSQNRIMLSHFHVKASRRRFVI